MSVYYTTNKVTASMALISTSERNKSDVSKIIFRLQYNSHTGTGSRMHLLYETIALPQCNMLDTLIKPHYFSSPLC